MRFSVGTKTIEGKVVDPKKTEEKLADQISYGDIDDMVSENKNSLNLHRINVGSILPGDEVKVEIHAI